MTSKKKKTRRRLLRQRIRDKKQVVRRHFEKQEQGSNSADDNDEITWGFEYHQTVFARWRAELQEEKKLGVEPTPERRKFWEERNEGTYSPSEARPLVIEYIEFISKELQGRISSHSLSWWLHLIRRMPLVAVGTNGRHRTIALTRRIYEAAIHKWANINEVHDVENSSEIVPDKILAGHFIRYVPAQLIESFKQSTQLVLTDFDVTDFEFALNSEKLAYELWRSMAQLRAIGKGAELVVDVADPEISYERRGSGLDFLIRSFDTRLTNEEFDATATGMVFGKAESGDGLVFVPAYNIDQVTNEAFVAIVDAFTKRQFRPLEYDSKGPMFFWHGMDLLEFYASHKWFSDAFLSKHGVKLESVLSVIAAIAYEAILSIRHPELLWRYWQRGYIGPLKLSEYQSAILAAMPTVLDVLKLPFDQQSISVQDGIDFLTLTEAKRSGIGVEYPGPFHIFLPFRDGRYFVDFAHLTMLLYHLFHDVRVSDQNFKGDALEAIARFAPPPLSSLPLSARNGTSKQIDASFEIMDLLVIAECRAVGRSIGVDRGDIRALETRQKLVDKALLDIDDKAKWLVANPIGSNYDISKYRNILGIGITPFIEYIHNDAPHYWIENGIPRVLTIPELEDELKKASFYSYAIRCPNTLKR